MEPLGAGKWNGEGMWGGGQFTSNLGPGRTRIAPRRKEGFQVSKGDPVAKGVVRGNWQRELTREINGKLRHMFVLSSCIYVPCYCVNVANKRTVFRL